MIFRQAVVLLLCTSASAFVATPFGGVRSCSTRSVDIKVLELSDTDAASSGETEAASTVEVAEPAEAAEAAVEPAEAAEAAVEPADAVEAAVEPADAVEPAADVADPVEATDAAEAPAAEGEEKAAPVKVPQPERFTAFVGNIPFDTSVGELKSFFSEAAPVRFVNMPLNQETGKSRGFAFLDMNSKEDLDTIIEKTNGTSFGGRTMRVTESVPRDEVQGQGKKDTEEKGMKKLYIGNLSFDATPEDVKDLFSEASTVYDVYLPRRLDTDTPRGFGFVTIDEESIQSTIDKFNGFEFLGRTLTVSEPLPPGAKAPGRASGPPRTKLYVGNLSFYTSRDLLMSLFSEFGPVHDCYIPQDMETGSSRGFAFVTMDKDDAQAAIDELDNCEVEGRLIRVNEAQIKKPRRSFDSFRDEEEFGSDDE